MAPALWVVIYGSCFLGDSLWLMLSGWLFMARACPLQFMAPVFLVASYGSYFPVAIYGSCFLCGFLLYGWQFMASAFWVAIYGSRYLGCFFWLLFS